MKPKLDRERITRAFDLALQLHGSQWRKRSPGETTPEIPYIAHLMSVAALVLEHGGNEDEAIAALLHDGPEDQGGEATLAAIHEEFGEEVGTIVEACSDTFAQPKPDWWRRKRIYLDHLGNSASDSLLLVSLADKVHNLGSIFNDYQRIGSELWKRFDQGRDGTLWYYTRLQRIYRDANSVRCRHLIVEFESILGRLVAEVVRREEALPEAWTEHDGLGR